ncbi:MAG: alpha/beta hydrolase [Pyrinomonadaceae bacterium]
MSNDADSTRTERSLAAEVKLYYDLDVPADAGTPAPLLIALHGYGDNKAWMMREARKLAPVGFAVAALQGFHQHMKKAKRDGAPFGYGFGWLTNFRAEESVALHHRALLDLIEPLVREGIAIREQIYLLGFSQSVALNYRFVFAYPNIVRGVVGICGGLPGDWETSEVYMASETSVLHLCGARDEFYPPARVEDYLRRLSTRAADVELKSYDAAHEIAPAMRDDVRVWLQSRASI